MTRSRVVLVDRRGLLRGGLASAAGGMFGGCDRFLFPDPGGFLDSLDAITPTDQFYVYDCCGVPEIDPARWRLEIRLAGVAVDAIDAEWLVAQPADQVERTLECIGASPIALQISNAWWSGIRLDALLALRGIVIPAEAREIVARCADGYHTSLPLTDLEAPIRVAWAMNGDPLLPEHGAPARLLVPNRYGMKNPKWLEALDFVNEPHTGYWEGQGWSSAAIVRPNALIHGLVDGAIVSAGPVRILGTAFAGIDPIERVEVSLDDGETWMDAEIVYASTPDTWTLWRLDVDLGPGGYAVRVRATTESGRATGEPSGSNPWIGYDGGMRVTLRVTD